MREGKQIPDRPKPLWYEVGVLPLVTAKAPQPAVRVTLNERGDRLSFTCGVLISGVFKPQLHMPDRDLPDFVLLLNELQHLSAVLDGTKDRDESLSILRGTLAHLTSTLSAA